ncbi:MAG TPA: glycosyltransferase family 39 protein [Sedimentisphaerales bacterium]|nr:glycosyltransferase family 39 protein [Sedimentisphaerales bacterium]
MKQDRKSDVGGNNGMLRKTMSHHWAWAVLVLILVFAGGIRYRLRDMPLERDEGEYAYMGQLMLQGIPPYEAAYNMKFPGIYAAYAAILAVFGQTASGIRLGVLLVDAANIVLIFIIAKRMWSDLAGLMAAATYALFTLGKGSLGLAGHATHFVVLPALGALLLMLHARNNRRMWPHFVMGILLGLSVLMKQPGALYIPFFFIFPLWDELRRRPVLWKPIVHRSLSLAFGVALALLITVFIIWRVGVFERFWFWTVSYAITYASQVEPQHIFLVFRMGMGVVIQSTWPLWILAAAGFVLLCFKRSDTRQLFFIATFTFFSFLAVCPAFLFRQHYFIVMMPAVAMLIGGGLSFASELLARRAARPLAAAPILIFLAAWGFSFYQEHVLFLKLTPPQASRHLYGTNPFPESVHVAEYIRNRTSPDDLIAVIGSEPQIYFYANRRSATGHIYTYGMMEDNPYALKMQKEMARQIEAASPKYVVFVNIFSSWLQRPTSPTYIFDWFRNYVSSGTLEGVVELTPQGTRYTWGPDAANAVPTTNNYLLIFRLR